MSTALHPQPLATPTTTRRRTWFPAGLAVVAISAGLVRLSALTGGLLRFPVDYDEGVYSAAGQALAHGQIPYRDFVFVHPPGIAYLFALLAPLGPYRALVAARLLAVLAGIASTVLVGVVARRAWGATPALAAASVYAVFPEAVWVEHGAFIEPWLNLLTICTVACWMEARRADRPVGPVSWASMTGAMLGGAVGFKLWALLLVPALLVVPPVTARAWQLAHAAIGFAVASVVIWTPMLVLAGPAPVWRDVVTFQLTRPPDGVADRGERAKLLLLDPGDLLASRHLAVTLLVVVGLVAWRWRDPLARLAAVWLATFLAAFMLAATYWDQYNAALALPMALLAGYGAARLMANRVMAARASATVLVAVAVAWTAHTALIEGRTAGGEPAVIAEALRHIDAGIEVCAYEPGWLLAAGRDVPAETSSVDPYASWLIGTPQPDCPVVATGARGRRQIGEEGWAAFVAGRQQISNTGVWVRLDR